MINYKTIKSALCVGVGLFVGATALTAQPKVVKINAMKANDYGIRYVLPKTMLQINIEYNEVRQKAGVYARYASRYLGISESEIVAEDRIFYTLEKITMTETYMPDKGQSYVVLFNKPKNTAPFVCLTEDGLLCAINAEYEMPQSAITEAVTTTTSKKEPSVQSIFTEEYLRAGSVGKMAEIAAKNLYAVRESRQDLLTGETENVPKDGAAMKLILDNLNAQEKQWTELFTGTTQISAMRRQLLVEPEAEVRQAILFRFSKYAGVVDADDLSGTPIYWNLTDLKTVETNAVGVPNSPQLSDCLVYNNPGKATVEIFYDAQPVFSKTIDITQFGVKEMLTPSLFESKKEAVKIYFYPHLGAIRQITQ